MITAQTDSYNSSFAIAGVFLLVGIGLTLVLQKRIAAAEKAA